MPKLTVLMPAYNAEKTINCAIKSTLAALPKGAALLVYDDASTDKTAQILKKWSHKDPRIRWYSAKSNGGITTGLQWLLHHADSPWVARMDADDLCLPWRFQPAWLIAQALGLDFCFTGSLNVDDRLRPLRPTVPWPLGSAAFKYDLIVDNSLFHGALIARRETMMQLGGYREVEAEDYDLWLRAVLAGARCLRVPWQGYLYRSHALQITQSDHHAKAFRQSPQLAQSHAQLTLMAVGRRFDVFSALHAGSQPISQEVREQISQLADAMDSNIAADRSLHWWDRAFLTKRRVSRLRRLAEGVGHG